MLRWLHSIVLRRRARGFAVCLLALSLASCAPAPIRTSLPAQWWPSPNFDERRPNAIVLHHTTSNSVQRALASLTDRDHGVSAHYLIGRDGAWYQLVDERARAWHAGESKWGSDTDLNSSSIGIELDNNGEELFPEAQIATLIALLRDLCERYKIPRENVLAHADVAPTRKVDPSRYFPWRRLAADGFGLWCDEPSVRPPVDFDPLAALQVVGYDLTDPVAAMHAFRLHYGGDDSSPQLTERDRALLYCLQEKRRTNPPTHSSR